MIKTVTPQELRKAFDAIGWNDYTLIETLPDGSEILVGDIFAAIAAAVQAERQACAKVADEYDYESQPEDNGANMARIEIAAAIRARNGAEG